MLNEMHIQLYMQEGTPQFWMGSDSVLTYGRVATREITTGLPREIFRFDATPSYCRVDMSEDVEYENVFSSDGGAF